MGCGTSSVVIGVDLFNEAALREADEAFSVEVLTALARRSLRYILATGDRRTLIASGVRYEPERNETWLSRERLLCLGAGDCEDIAVAYLAERWAAGDSGARFVLERGADRYHAVVRHGDGTRFDPSALLGMNRRI